MPTLYTFSFTVSDASPLFKSIVMECKEKNLTAQIVIKNRLEKQNIKINKKRNLLCL